MDTHNLKSIQIEGAQLRYVKFGHGEPVVLVHGSNSDYRIWTEHCELISQRYRVIALSQRYFGGTPWSDAGERFNVSDLANDLGAFVHGLGTGPVTLVGWSFGGAISLTMALRRPDIVKRMFLYEPSLATFVTVPQEAKTALDDRLDMMRAAKPLAAAGDLAGAVREFMNGVNADDGAFDSLSAEVRSMMTENARMLPLLFAGPPPPSVCAADLQGLKVPVTIGIGQDSRIGYQIAARTAASLLPGGQLTVVKSARHLWPIQWPQEFAKLVLDFLDRP